jgi:hypothetical protein
MDFAPAEIFAPFPTAIPKFAVAVQQQNHLFAEPPMDPGTTMAASPLKVAGIERQYSDWLNQSHS